MSLGGTGWNAELDPKTTDHAMWQTLTLFSKFRPKWVWRPLGQTFGDATFDMSSEEDGTRVVDVKFQKQNITYYRSSHYPLYGEYRGFKEPRRIFQLLVAEDRYSSFLGSQPTWKWDDPSKTLFISTQMALTGALATALLLQPLKVEEIPFHLEYDFLEGAVGHTKLILARILRKFGGIPAAQGNITLDASELQTEGQEAINNLRDNLDRNMRHMPPRPIF